MMMIFGYQLAVILMIGKLFASGEWVEMPEFSDESKIYKLSPHKHAAFYSEFPNNYDRIVPQYETKITGDHSNEFHNVGTNDSTNGVIVSYDAKEEERELVASSESVRLTTINYPESDSKEIASGTAESSSVILESPNEELLAGASTTVKPTLPTTVPRDSPSGKVSYRNQTIADDDDDEVKVENYLPMEMLKKVHQTLKSQSTTLHGKMKFLKRFEKDLITEIEKRLSIALAPTRQTRGTHDYYDHDEEIGFPSLEGALMSISFLTFAVYLVRLVMLLFRNPNPSTAAATIFFGRNRRSTDLLINNNSEEVLNYLNTFDAY